MVSNAHWILSLNSILNLENESSIKVCLLPVGGGVVDPTGSYASTPFLTPFQARGVNDCSKVNGCRDPCCKTTNMFSQPRPREVKHNRL